MNILKNKSLSISQIIYLEKIPRSRMLFKFLSFYIVKLLSRRTVPIYAPSSNVWEYPFTFPATQNSDLCGSYSTFPRNRKEVVAHFLNLPFVRLSVKNWSQWYRNSLRRGRIPQACWHYSRLQILWLQMHRMSIQQLRKEGWLPWTWVSRSRLLVCSVILQVKYDISSCEIDGLTL